MFYLNLSWLLPEGVEGNPFPRQPDIQLASKSIKCCTKGSAGLDNLKAVFGIS